VPPGVEIPTAGGLRLYVRGWHLETETHSGPARRPDRVVGQRRAPYFRSFLTSRQRPSLETL